MANPWIPRFVYGSTPTTLTLTISQRYFNPEDFTVGGTDTAAAGVPVAYVIRRDALLSCQLRFRESEWSDVHAMIVYGQAHPNTLTFYPDYTSTTSYTVYLESPKMGTHWRPERSEEFPEVFELPITLRETSGTLWTLEWFA